MTHEQEGKIDALIERVERVDDLLERVTRLVHQVELLRGEERRHGKELGELAARVEALESKPPEAA